MHINRALIYSVVNSSTELSYEFYRLRSNLSLDYRLECNRRIGEDKDKSLWVIYTTCKIEKKVFEPNRGGCSQAYKIS